MGTEVQADGDDDGAGDDGREEAHDLLDAVGLEERGKNRVHDAHAGHAAAGVDQQVGLAVGGDGGIAGDEGEGGAQEGRNLALGQHMEQQRAETGKQQRGGNVQAGQRRDEHGGAKHGKHVLQTQDDHFGTAQHPRVIHGPVDGFLVVHSITLSL